MRYALLIYRDEAATAQMRLQELQALLAGHGALVGELGAKLTGGAPLQFSKPTWRVRSPEM